MIMHGKERAFWPVWFGAARLGMERRGNVVSGLVRNGPSGRYGAVWSSQAWRDLVCCGEVWNGYFGGAFRYL